MKNRIQSLEQGERLPVASEETPSRAAGEQFKPVADRKVTIASLGILAVFVLATLIFPKQSSDAINEGFAFSAKWVGFYWQALLLATFVCSIALALTPYARARLGGHVSPDYGRFKWVAMIMCTLLAGGGVFWAAAEPISHYIASPPYYGEPSGDPTEAAHIALGQTFVHWGFLAWAILGSLGAIVMTHAVSKGMPLRPRTLLYPVMGRRVLKSWIGTVADVVCIIAVVAGTVGPIGFLGLQVSYGLSRLFGVPNNYGTQLIIIAVLTGLAALSVSSGLSKGIQLMSRLNVWLALGLMAAVLVLGSAAYIFKSFVGGFGVYLQNFVGTSLYQGDQGWVSGWTVFFFAWFLGYAPLMAIFVATISRGRTVRELILFTAVLPPIVTCFWFTVLGGTGIMFEQQNPGSISGPLASDGLPAVVMTIAEQLPFSGIIATAFLVLTIMFVATTADSMSFSIAQSCTIEGEPSTKLRAAWAVTMGVAAAVLISIGDGGISALQSFIVITAVPVGFIILPSLFAAPVFVRRMALEQGVLDRKPRGVRP
ncbi:BCCT family transporter [Pseudarthrobacter sp. AB1]|uniref:BCCT family transporter n=1 Tax=Pseudarthrobacter sp. AB1 TaxID=2138309 RepID=UPI00186B6F2E|nr:BCCT family transporter [Pseudarthrobacter sp. AB1]MBE4720437.1 BCCT transporter [Pseudarthrobacter sp. AB1]